MSVVIRNELPADVEAIHALTVAAFLNAPHTGHTEQFIVRALRDASAMAVSLVADRDGELIGHVVLSKVVIGNNETPDDDWYGLGPISVSPDAQRQGVGSQLMVAAMTRLAEMGAGGCVLLGDPAFYQRFGFAPQPGLVYPGVPPEYFMARRFAGSWPLGDVSYHEAFAATA